VLDVVEQRDCEARCTQLNKATQMGPKMNVVMGMLLKIAIMAIPLRDYLLPLVCVCLLLQ